MRYGGDGNGSFGGLSPYSSFTYSSPTFTGQGLFADGSAAAPSIAFTSKTDLGLYYTTNALNFSVGSALGVSMGANGTVFSLPIRQGAPVTETGATHIVAASTAYLICNRAGDVLVTLPAAGTYTGRQLIIRTIQAQTVTSNASNVVPRLGGAAGTAILGAVAGAWALLVSDGTNWEIMAGS